MQSPQSPVSSPKVLVSILFSAAILAGAVWVLSPFLLAILWAGIIATAFWPLHCRMLKRYPDSPNWAAFGSTLLVGFLLVGPMIVLLLFVVNDVITLTNALLEADQNGVPPPDWIRHIPYVGPYLLNRWVEYLAQPDRISALIREAFSDRLAWAQSAAQSVLFDLLSRVATLFFALWVLFFFYRDGRRLAAKLNAIGNDWLGHRWLPYISQVPMAVHAAVNGLVIVAFVEAGLLAGLFAAAKLPVPALLACFTVILAFIPMAAPVLLLMIAGLCFTAGEIGAAMMIIIIGNLIVVGADYLVRPLLIQGGTHLPFLAVLFGVFGGLITMGIVGLVIGPVLLVLLVVFVNEATHLGKQKTVIHPKP